MKVLEKFKNKKVFILYLVGVLLLSTSVSFAYFTSRTNTSGEGGVAVGTTTTIKSEGINAEGTIEFNNVDMYPGHIGIAGIKVTATGTTPMIYNVVFNGTNTFTTPLNYTIYKTTTEIDVSYTCNKREERQGVNTIYYEECTGNNIEQLGSAVKTGTIHTNEGKTTLLDSEIILGTEEGEEVYYYVVMEFPNEEENQNDDIGSSISGNITIEEGDEYKNPEVTLTGTIVSGNNGWVKSASINANVETQTGKYEALYCTTTEDSCTPNTSANISDNTFSVTLNNNSSAQKICVEVTDEYNQKANGCSEVYKVDGEIPNVTIASSSSTENSITVTVNGSDTHSGIVQYRFSNNGGSSYTEVSSTNNSYTYTFNGLNDGTTYTIAVQAIDEAGNTSSTVTRSVATEKSGDTMQEIIAGYNIGNRGSFSSVYTTTTTNTVFQTTDWKGTSYYFAGAPTDNWVRFGGFYWRIVRVNGDGSVRLIYNGTSTTTTGTGTMINSSQAFNSSYNRSEYVGLKYTSGQQHGQTENSDILIELQSWYSSSGLSANQYSQYIDTSVGFCSDRNMNSGSSWSSQPSSTIYYAAYGRIEQNQSPSLSCTSSDIIAEPVGLITADEAMFGGVPWSGNATGNYLINGQVYWTISPSYFNAADSHAYVFRVGSVGYLYGVVDGTRGVRPVINLKANTKFQGSGTTTDPYVVV